MVGYAPIVDAKASDMSAVYAVMLKYTEMSHKLVSHIQCEQWTAVLCYKEGVWHLPDEFNNHTMRLGGFHTQ